MKKMLRACCFLVLVLVAWSTKTLAQDLIYSQFYNAPGYLNPALSGEFEGDIRVNMIYRSQWTKIQGALDNYTFSVDYQLPVFGGGIGLIMNKSTEGTAYLSKLNLATVLSYNVPLDNYTTLSFGLQAGIINRRVDEQKLLFADQLDNNGIITGAGSAASVLVNNNRNFFDGGAGINLVADKFMVGGSAQHINRPNESLTGQESKLPMRYGIYTSYMISLDKYGEDLPAIIPSLVMYRQDKSNSISAGFQFKTSSINLGLWYRGDGKQHDAIVFSVILDLFRPDRTSSKFRLGLSHDATTSKINYSSTSGTSEAAFVFETDIPGRSEARYNRRADNNFNKCYNFY